MDEIGRGTSTYDGMSIARAVMEHCVYTLGAKTIFSTHYHELSRVAAEMDGARNFNIAVRKQGDKVVFLRKIVPGSASKSYGVEVAALAGVPEEVVTRADHLLRCLEMEQKLSQERAQRGLRPDDKVVVSTEDGPKEYPAWAAEAAEAVRKEIKIRQQAIARGETPEYDMTTWFPKDIDLVVRTYGAGLPVLEQLYQTDVDNLTPLEALELVAELKQHIARANWKWELKWPEQKKPGDPD